MKTNETNQFNNIPTYTTACFIWGSKAQKEKTRYKNLALSTSLIKGQDNEMNLG